MASNKQFSIYNLVPRLGDFRTDQVVTNIEIWSVGSKTCQDLLAYYFLIEAHLKIYTFSDH